MHRFRTRSRNRARTTRLTKPPRIKRSQQNGRDRRCSIAGFYLGSVFVLSGLATIIGALGYFNSFVLLAVLAVVAMVFMLIAVASSPMKKEKKAEE